MRPLTAVQVLRAELARPRVRPLLAPLIEREHLQDLLQMYWLVEESDDRWKREAYGDLAEMLKHAERLLLGEYIDRPIHEGATHAHHVQVITLAISSLLHPEKTRKPRKGSQTYNDLARRRIARWFWAATFASPPMSTHTVIENEAQTLATWARASAPEAEAAARPRVVAELRAPAMEWLDQISYRRKDWRYWVVLALLARADPQDPLTGQRLSVDRMTGTMINGDHIFPQKWAGWSHHDASDARDSIVNIAAITQYTNIWKGKRAPSEYVSRILRLGVSNQRLRIILAEHCVDLDDLLADDWSGFYAKRRQLIYELIVGHLNSECEV